MILILCEKENAARRIAHILSKGKASRSVSKKVSLYVFSMDGKKYTVMGLRGHILNLDYPAKYNQWDRIDLKDLIWVEPYKKIQAQNIVDVLKKIIPDMEEIIIATDYDREGELIGVEGLEIVKGINPNIISSRARFSALTSEEVIRAFNNLTDIDYNLSSSAESRQIIDLAWGAVLTRFISLTSRQIGKDFLSVGRVQSPTLALIVDKEKLIQDFKPKPYWELVAKLKKDIDFSAKHEEDKFWDEKVSKSIYDKVKKAEEGTIVQVNKRSKTDKPPTPFNTTAYLQAATSLGFTAAAAMTIAEDLYTNGWISYPRTDNTEYPPSLNLRGILQKFKGTDLSDLASELLSQPTLKPTKGKTRATDHPPIHPVEGASSNQLDKRQWKIYELIVRRFFATLAPEAKIQTQKVNIDIEEEVFLADGIRILEPGWMKFYPYIGSKEKKIPELKKGDKVKVIKIDLLSKETQPPKRYGQGGLIQEMDRLGLGTKSTRHEIIQKLYNRGYVTGTSPRPTVMGFAVTDALETYAELITKPDMTASLEKEMDRISLGKLKIDKVVKDSQKMLTDILAELEKNKEVIGNSIREAFLEQSTIGKCSKCGSNLIVLRSHRGKRFIGCSKYPKCRMSFPLPQRGKLEAEENPCEVCGSPRVRILLRKQKPWEFCVNMKCASRSKENKKD
ncbi:MAG: DNA topoisomerase I [Thermoplasmata archaeon]|nr:MAG: DNA topoisomerase I [Thermoplasmata archaeon]